MDFIVRLYSNNKDDINNFLKKFSNNTEEYMNLSEWEKKYQNPVELTDIIGTFIDNNDKYSINMWISLDKGVFINVTDDNANEIIKLIPLDRILIETDSPYLSPEPNRGRRNDSRNVKYIAEKIANVKKMQLEEMIAGIEKEELLIVKDYLVPTKKKRTPETVLDEISELQYEDLTKESNIAKLLGFENFDNYDEVAVYTRGYRILNKIPRMPSNIVENLISSFKSFQHILAADIESLDEVDGIGEVRARTIKQSLKRMQEQFVFDNVLL